MSSNSQPLSNNPINSIQRVSLNSQLSSVILDSDSGNSSLTIRNASNTSLYIDKFSNVGLGTSSPSSQLEVASANGACLRLRYGTSSSAFSSIFMETGGNLTIGTNTTNSDVVVSSNLNLSNHNGTSRGLKLNGTLVSSTAAQLNYNTVTAGTASASKSLVLDSSLNVSGINVLGTTQITIGAATLGGTEAAYLTGITPGTGLANKSLVLDSAKNIAGINQLNITSLILNGTDVTGSIAASAYITGVTPGTALANKALILDGAKSIVDISSLSTTSITVGGVSVQGELDYITGITLGTASPSKALILNSSRNITNIASLGATALNVGGSVITSAEANYIVGLTVGTASASKALVVDSNKSISGIASIGLTGVSNILTMANTTASEYVAETFQSDTYSLSIGVRGSTNATNPNTAYLFYNNAYAMLINSSGNIAIGSNSFTSKLNIGGAINATGYLLDGSALDFTNLGYIIGVTKGVGSNGKALVLSDTGTITSGVSSFAMTTLVLNGSSISAEAAYVSGATVGSVTASKVVVANASSEISGLAKVGTTTLTLGGTDLTSTHANYLTSITPGTTASNKALVVGASRTIDYLKSGVFDATTYQQGGSTYDLSLLSPTAGTTTANKALIVGTGRTIDYLKSGTFDATTYQQGGTTYDLSLLSATAGTVAASKALIVNSSSNLSGLNQLLMTNATGVATTGYGIGSPSLILSISNRNCSTSDNFRAMTISGVTLTDTATSASSTSSFSPAYAYINQPTLAATNASVTMTNAYTMFINNAPTAGTNTTITNAYALYVNAGRSHFDANIASSSTTTGTLTVRGGLGVSGTVSATTLTGTISTAAQPNITSLGTLSSLSVSGGISATTLTGTLATAAQPNITSVGTLTSLTVSGALNGTLATAAQPNITSVGTLTSLTVSGSITGTLATVDQPNITSIGTLGSLTVSGALNGTLATAAQPNITSVGTLTSLTVSGALNGTLATAAQPNITSVGTLTGLTSGPVAMNPTNKTITGGQTSTNCIWHSTLDRRYGMRQPDLNTFVMLAYSAGGVYGDYMTWAHGATVNLTIAGTMQSTGYYANGSLVIDSSQNGSFANITGTNLTMNGTVVEVGATTWAVRASASDNNWRGICWSSELGLFAAVAQSGTGTRVMTSPDGTTWTTRTSATDNSWTAVCWSPELGLFVAVGDTGSGNRVMTSSNGTTWASRTSAVDNSWRSVCWSSELGLFVAVAVTGTGDRVMTSSNGTTWTSRSSIADNNWNSVCWSPDLGLFAAVSDSGTGNRVMTSPDGISWTSRTSATDNAWRSVCWSPELGMFVAVAASGTGNRVMTSSTGTTWVSRTSAVDNDWYSVCWANELGLLVAVAITGTGDRVMTSSDGLAWNTRTSAANNQWMSICWSPDLSSFAAVANSGTGNRVMTSSHRTVSSLTLASNIAATGITNASKLRIVPTTKMNYYGGLNGGHVWYNETTTNTANELMRLTSKGCGIGVKNPTNKLDISDPNGNCLKLRYGMSRSVVLGVNSSGAFLVNGSPISADGDITITRAAQPNIASVNALDITTHDGSSVGLKLGGVLVSATATELNYTDVVAGAATASKALVLDSSSNISGIASLSATSLTGTIQTAAQSNITSVGTLTSLTVSGALNGTLSTAAQPNITSVGTLTSLTVSGNIGGTLTTAAQPNIATVAALDITTHNGSTVGLKLGGVLVSATAAQLNFNTVTAGTAAASKALVLNASGNITGIASLSATSLTGTLQTAAQTNITSVGTLTSLTVSGALNGTLATAAQTNITSVGTLTALNVSSKYVVTNSAAANTTRVFESNNTSGTTTTLTIKHAGGAGASIGMASNASFTVHTNDLERMRITGSTGFVSISDNGSNASCPLEVFTSTSLSLGANYGYSNTGVANNTSGGNATVSLKTAASIWCQGTVYVTSDARLKQDVNDIAIESSLPLLSAKSVSYKLKSCPDGPTETGFLAQDLIKCGMGSVVTAVPNKETDDGISYIVSYDRIGPHLLNIIKDNRSEIDSLKAQLAKVLERLDALESA